MPGVEVTSRGALLDGTAPERVRRTTRRWLQGTLGAMRDYARSIAPVKTGRFRGSIRFRTRDTGTGLEGELYSDDAFGKVYAIEYGHTTRQPNRVGRYPFKRTYDHFNGLLRTQARVLESSLVEDLR